MKDLVHVNGAKKDKLDQRSVPVVNIADVEREALKRIPKHSLDYYRSGAGDEITLAENCLAFNHLRIRPRFLRDMSTRVTATTVLGIPVSFPVLVAPTAMQRMATPLGEVANALACEAEGTIMTLSTISTSSLEEVAHATPNSPKFFQLYIYRDRELTRRLVKRAERAGYRALVLTVDTPFFGQRYADERNHFKLDAHLKMANFEEEDKEASSRMCRVEANLKSGSSGLAEYANSLFDPSITWEDISWLKSITSLPIVAKGILTREDAVKALDAGCSAIQVSNHGGRQLDTVPATIEALIEVVDAVQGRCEVYLDSGVRRGTDVFKALALGARAVFIGRPMVYGLAYDGLAGGRKVLQMLRREFEQTMGLAGCATLAEIQRSMIVPAGYLLSKL